MTAARGLALRLAVWLGLAAIVVAVDGALSLRVDPLIAFLTAVVVAVGTWAGAHLRPAGEPPEWVQPSWETRSPHFQADIRTRRTSSMLAHAQPGRDFDARRLARQLGDLTARRLVLSGRVPDGVPDPLAHADGAVSPALLRYLRSAEADHAQVLARKTLHAHLKEIDSL
ncbi:hypothetical protein [Tessaracoccus lapidicaptus]|uniref:hypothetical protein n=1 Tax=Tessaracoccus lapidicaptus TaxID=1427523 RepID=UPI00333E6097